MRACCVIGGTGFIGSHLIPALIKKNRQITVIGRSRTPSRPLPKTVRYFCQDYTALKDTNEIICLAYSTVPATSIKNPVDDLLKNLPPYLQIFEIASKLPIKKLVLISSGGAIYGETTKTPISEDYPTRPISPYGVTKLTIEKYALMYHKLRGLPVVSLRPSNAFGIGQRPFTGQGFIATAMASILNNKEITVFGKQGTIRDYVYVTDVAKAIISALEKGQSGQVYNVGSGTGRSNMDVLDAIFPFARSAGLSPKVNHLPARHFDVPVNILDSHRLAYDTGWKITVPFEEGIRKTWYWFYNLSSGISSPRRKF